MPLCSTHELRQTCLTLGAALLITILGAPLSIHAQQLDTSNSSTSSSNDGPAVVPPLSASELPDAPSALLYPQAAQAPSSTSTSSGPPTADNPDAVSPTGNHQTKRVLGSRPTFRAVSD